jgi:hypothetical protein
MEELAHLAVVSLLDSALVGTSLIQFLLELLGRVLYCANLVLTRLLGETQQLESTVG